MDMATRAKLITIAKRSIHNDLSHDFSHAMRVLGLVERIGRLEHADMDVLVPAALFHDFFVYKGTSRHAYEHEMSARKASRILSGLASYPKSKISQVSYAISVCSFSRNIAPTTLEAMVLQDADMLEATGAIAVMRTFASASSMNKRFYKMEEPIPHRRRPRARDYAIDLFFERLLVAEGRMRTAAAKRMARRRTAFLEEFIGEFERELKEAGKAVYIS